MRSTKPDSIQSVFQELGSRSHAWWQPCAGTRPSAQAPRARQEVFGPESPIPTPQVKAKKKHHLLRLPLATEGKCPGWELKAHSVQA